MKTNYEKKHYTITTKESSRQKFLSKKNWFLRIFFSVASTGCHFVSKNIFADKITPKETNKRWQLERKKIWMHEEHVYNDFENNEKKFSWIWRGWQNKKVQFFEPQNLGIINEWHTKQIQYGVEKIHIEKRIQNSKSNLNLKNRNRAKAILKKSKKLTRKRSHNRSKSNGQMIIVVVWLCVMIFFLVSRILSHR